MTPSEPVCRPTTASPAAPVHPGCPARTPGAITTHGAGEPGPLYAHLRQAHPVYHDPLLDVWVVSRHQDIDTVLRDASGTFSTALGYLPLHPLTPEAQAVLDRSDAVPVLSSLDPPDHARFRRAMTATFPTTDRRLTLWRDLIRERATAAATALVARASRTADLVTDYAQPLAGTVLGHFLGVPDRDQPAIARQAAALSGLVWGHLDPPGQLAAAHALDELWTYCRTLVHHRTRSPADDLITAWLTHADDTGPFTA
ncbi:hypothetical protein QWJ26_19465 [Streptomyces sp. CSDS2]|uniref:hypothetical protein n=1 Tax=Streptomyces sp. CSDS2 TaxID=3055051 RepID=UPI0025AFA201|nr:hypothetical protein [Streptomyces sp. CSDS2]MDN3261947.1 hypothetical protein [Streptomyces sp. CSDS2]